MYFEQFHVCMCMVTTNNQVGTEWVSGLDIIYTVVSQLCSGQDPEIILSQLNSSAHIHTQGQHLYHHHHDAGISYVPGYQYDLMIKLIRQPRQCRLIGWIISASHGVETIFGSIAQVHMTQSHHFISSHKLVIKSAHNSG